MCKLNICCGQLFYSYVVKNFLVLSVVLFSATVSADVGKVVYGYGSNHAFDSDGNRRELSKGSKIAEGDTLVTSSGRMHIRMVDGGFISLYPDSEYKIEKFKFSGASQTGKKGKAKKVEDKKENRGFFSLLKGAARQVTGILGRRYNDNFKFKTSVATIGIRGTGFFARLCQADCFDADGNPMQDGLYVKNNTGVIMMTNNAGDIALAQGQSAFAASFEDSPRQVLQPPVVYNLVSPDIELYDFDEKVVDTRLDKNFEFTPIDPPIDPPIEPPVIPPVVPQVVVTKLEHVTTTSLFFSAPLLGLDTANASDSLVQNGDAIEQFIGPGNDGVSTFDNGTATLSESGSDITLGVLWNRWTKGFTYDDGVGGVSLDDNIHLIGSETVTQNLPTSGLVDYVGTGGTQPTFIGASGTTQVGTQTVSATIDFGRAEVMALDINTVFPDATTVNALLSNTSGNTFLSASGNVYGMSATCSGNDCGGNGLSLTGQASVNMVGTNAEGIYGIYNLTSGSGENALSGSYVATETVPLP